MSDTDQVPDKPFPDGATVTWREPEEGEEWYREYLILLDKYGRGPFEIMETLIRHDSELRPYCVSTLKRLGAQGEFLRSSAFDPEPFLTDWLMSVVIPS